MNPCLRHGDFVYLRTPVSGADVGYYVFQEVVGKHIRLYPAPGFCIDMTGSKVTLPCACGIHLRPVLEINVFDLFIDPIASVMKIP